MRTFPILKMVLNDQNVEFRDTAILECKVLQETHPISLELPVSTASVVVYTEDTRYSTFSDGEFYTSLSKNLPVDLYESVDGVETLIGKFYLDKWSAPSDYRMKFDLVDALGVCANTDYLGSFWTSATAITTVIADVLGPTGITPTIAAGIASRTVKGWIPPGKVREALQQVCYAARCLVSTAKSNGISFADAALPVGVLTGYYGTFNYGTANYGGDPYYKPLTDADKTNKQNLTHLPLVTEIILKSHDYYNLGDVAQATDEIYSAYLEPGDYTIVYSKPYFKVWVDGVGGEPIYTATEDGKVVVTEDSTGAWGDATVRVATESESFAFYSNYVVLHVVTAGDVKVLGYPWFDNVRVHRYTETVQGATPNAMSVDDATLVSADIAADVLAKTVEYFKLRYQQDVTLFPDATIKPGDIRMLSSLYGKFVAGITKKLESNLTGGYLIGAEFVGQERKAS